MSGTLRNLGMIVLGLLALVQAGCMLAAAGAVGAAAGAGYLYYHGLIYRDYQGNLADTTAAVRTALAELQLPVLREQNEDGSAAAALQTRTANGHAVRIYIDVVSGAIPTEGVITRVGIRVGVTGDDDVSVRILDQVSKHRPSPAVPSERLAPVPQGPANQPPAMGAPQPVKETASPPLAPVPVPAR